VSAPATGRPPTAAPGAAIATTALIGHGPAEHPAGGGNHEIPDGSRTGPITSAVSRWLPSVAQASAPGAARAARRETSA
jgi:hypothetical protein